MSGLASGILCRQHNSALSAVDAAGIDGMSELERFLQARGVRRHEGLRQRALQRYAVNGPLFERWLLKTMINIALGHTTPAGTKWAPPVEWVEVAFAKRHFSSGCGLYLCAPDSTTLELRRSRLSIEFLTQDGANIHGAEFDLNGWTILLSLAPLQTNRLQYRPDSVSDTDGPELRQVIAFNWE